MKVAKQTAWVGNRLVRKGSLVEDSDEVTATNPDLFRDASEEVERTRPKVFTSSSPENPPESKPTAERGPAPTTVKERKKPGPKPGTRRTRGTVTPAAPETPSTASTTEPPKEGS